MLTQIVPSPPRTTDATGPKAAAVTPDSNSPSWFPEPMNKVLAAATRPRMWSGVSICVRVWRITTLTVSALPDKARTASERMNDVESPKAIMHTP